MLVDFEFSLVYVLGCAYSMSTGFNIGSNLAAGGACLYAAHVEMVMLSQQSWNLRNEWKLRVLSLRWTDDLWLLVAGTPSPELQQALRAFTYRHAYAPALRLSRT